MMIGSGVRPRGTVTAIVVDAATGRELSRQACQNSVVAVGRNQIRDAIHGDAISAPSRFAVGTGSTAVADGDIQLVAEVWRDAFTSKTKSGGGVRIKYFLTPNLANGNTLRECGLFNAPSGGIMYARVVLGEAIVKTSSISVVFLWDLSWSVD